MPVSDVCGSLYARRTPAASAPAKSNPCRSVTDGPFAETKELVAGYLIIQVPSKAEAIEWAKRWPPLDGEVELEIRAVFEEDDFGAEFTPEQREAEARMRAQLAK